MNGPFGNQAGVDNFCRQLFQFSNQYVLKDPTFLHGLLLAICLIEKLRWAYFINVITSMEKISIGYALDRWDAAFYVK